MASEIKNPTGGAANNSSPFEQIKRVNQAGNEHWSSRDFAQVLGYADYRNFEQVIDRARMACFNSGQRLEDHFGDVTEMVGIGSGAQRSVKTVMMSKVCLLPRGAERRPGQGDRGAGANLLRRPDAPAGVER